jgi:hypothetical protein
MALSALVLACAGDNFDPSQPTVIIVDPANLQFTAIGDAADVHVTVRNRAGTDLVVPLHWSTLDAGVATVDNTGRVHATGAGQTEVHVTAANLTGTVRVFVTLSATRGLSREIVAAARFRLRAPD